MLVPPHRRHNTLAVLLGATALLVSNTSMLLAASASWTSQSILAANLAFSESDSHPAVAVNAYGRAAAVWNTPTSDGGFGLTSTSEVTAAVRPTAGGDWSAPMRLSPAGVPAQHAGATVDPVSGKVTVAWSANGVPSVSTSADGGLSWATSAVPVAAGFDFLPRTSLIDTDGKGNLTLVLTRYRATADGYDVVAITRRPNGTWRDPKVLTRSTGISLPASPGLEVIADGRALLSFGSTTFRRNATGIWSGPKTVNTSGFDVLDRAVADMDANGRGYMVLRLIKASQAAIYLSTSTPAGSWSLPRLMTGLESYYGGLRITGASAGRAMISATDDANHVRATVTTDGGNTWAAPADFGLGFAPAADGSENGLFALGWYGPGAAAITSTGSGKGTGPWVTSTVGTYAVTGTPTVAIAAGFGNRTARAAAAWERSSDPTLFANSIGASTARIAR